MNILNRLSTLLFGLIVAVMTVGLLPGISSAQAVELTVSTPSPVPVTSTQIIDGVCPDGNTITLSPIVPGAPGTTPQTTTCVGSTYSFTVTWTDVGTFPVTVSSSPIPLSVTKFVTVEPLPPVHVLTITTPTPVPNNSTQSVTGTCTDGDTITLPANTGFTVIAPNTVVCAGGTYTFQIIWNTVGTFPVLTESRIDPMSVLPDLTATQDVVVVPAPVLTVVSPSPVYVGTTWTISGTCNTGDTVTVASVPGSSIMAPTSTICDAMGTYTFPVTWTAPGTHPITVTSTSVPAGVTTSVIVLPLGGLTVTSPTPVPNWSTQTISGGCTPGYTVTLPVLPATTMTVPLSVLCSGAGTYTFTVTWDTPGTFTVTTESRLDPVAVLPDYTATQDVTVVPVLTVSHPSPVNRGYLGTVTGVCDAGNTISMPAIPNTSNTGIQSMTCTPAGTYTFGIQWPTSGTYTVVTHSHLPGVPITDPALLTATTTVVVNNPSSGGGSGGGSSSGSIPHTPIVMTVPVSTPAPVAVAAPAPASSRTCDPLRGYWHVGNRDAEIIRIKQFLNQHQGFDLDTTSNLYDEDMYDAVETFQSRYAPYILLPWGYQTDAPTGRWYQSTLNYANYLLGCQPDVIILDNGVVVGDYDHMQYPTTAARAEALSHENYRAKTARVVSGRVDIAGSHLAGYYDRLNGDAPLGDCVAYCKTGATSYSAELDTTITDAYCNAYLDEYITIDGDNSFRGVQMLQVFLNSHQNARLVVTGQYDQATVQAVRDFQNEYADQILAPIDLDAPTGNVFTMTLRQINAMHCQDLSFMGINDKTSIKQAVKPSQSSNSPLPPAVIEVPAGETVPANTGTGTSFWDQILGN